MKTNEENCNNVAMLPHKFISFSPSWEQITEWPKPSIRR